jgi:hypothetical protein
MTGTLTERFPLGAHFVIEGHDQVWRVTDVGTRVVIAIEHKPGWMEGPPYALAERVFDENDHAVMKLHEERLDKPGQPRARRRGPPATSAKTNLTSRHDSTEAFVELGTAARYYAVLGAAKEDDIRDKVTTNLICAAVAFVIQIAIEVADRDPTKMRALKNELVNALCAERTP